MMEQSKAKVSMSWSKAKVFILLPLNTARVALKSAFKPILLLWPDMHSDLDDPRRVRRVHRDAIPFR